MKKLSIRLLVISLLVMMMLSPLMLSGCVAKPPDFIRGDSEVRTVKDGDTVRIPASWSPRVGKLLSPEALEDLTRCCGEKSRE